jgi:hypothetical protein
MYEVDADFTPVLKKIALKIWQAVTNYENLTGKNLAAAVLS